MSFTLITVTGTFTRPDGSTPTYGTVTATLSHRIQNGTSIAEPSPIVGALNQAGQLVAQSLQPFELIANDDPATAPAGSFYTFVVELDGCPVETFDAVIPHTAPSSTLDFSTLEPTTP